MKKQLVPLAMVLIVFALSETSCKHTTSPNSNSNAPISAAVNGQTWSPIFGGFGHSGGLLRLYGANDSTEIDLQFSYLVTDTGVYVVDDSLIGASYSLRQKDYTAVPRSGILHLTTYTSSRAAGTFNFTAKASANDSVVVTNGKFNFAIQ